MLPWCDNLEAVQSTRWIHTRPLSVDLITASSLSWKQAKTPCTSMERCSLAIQSRAWTTNFAWPCKRTETWFVTITITHQVCTWGLPTLTEVQLARSFSRQMATLWSETQRVTLFGLQMLLSQTGPSESPCKAMANSSRTIRTTMTTTSKVRTVDVVMLSQFRSCCVVHLNAVGCNMALISDNKRICKTLFALTNHAQFWHAVLDV